jgi:hypothetical protein
MGSNNDRATVGTDADLDAVVALPRVESVDVILA